MSNLTPSKLDTIQTHLLSNLKKSPPNYNDVITILSDLRETIMPQIVHTPLYGHWLRTWIPLMKDILTDVNAVKKKGKDGKKDKDNKGGKEKKAHALFVRPRYSGVRKCLLEVLSKCPLNEVFHGYSSVVLGCCVNVLLVDYEENGLPALSLVYRIHKAYNVTSANLSAPTSIGRMKGEEAKILRECQVFLDFVCDCFSEANKSSGGSMERNFDFGKPSNVPSGDSKNTSSSLLAKQSFRVLSEASLILLLLFQMYSKQLKTNLPTMIPLMMDALKLVPPPFVDPSNGAGETPSTKDSAKEGSTPITPAIHAAGKGAGETQVIQTPNQPTSSTTPVTGISTTSAPQKDVLYRHYRIRAHELLSAQAKTLSFLTYLLGGFADQMRPHSEALANSVICLMKNCPREAISTRRDLITSTKHIVSTEFRRGFYRHIDIMMDERMIAGSSRHASYEQSLRPLGYSMLADFLSMARNRMTPAQLSRAVRIFSRVLNDVSMDMPLSLQIQAARLLFQLLLPIYTNNDPNPQVGRDLLLRILTAYIYKFRNVKSRISQLLLDVEKEINNSVDATCNNEFDACDGHVVGKKTSPSVALREIQALLRSMFYGLKTLIYYINSYSEGRKKERDRVLASGEEQFLLPQYAMVRENEEINSALSETTNSEFELFDEGIVSALLCLQAFRFSLESRNIDAPPNQQSSDLPNPKHKEMMQVFAQCIQPPHIKRMLVPKLSIMIDEMMKDGQLTEIFKSLLIASDQSVSYEVSAILFEYLTDNIAIVGNLLEAEGNEATSDHIRAQIHFKLFRLCISSIRNHPNNEVAILPNLCTVVKQCIQRSLSESTIWPGPYLFLLRELFRACYSKRGESESYKELASLAPAFLNGLHRLYSSTANETLRFVIIELALAFPARLPVVMPHLPLLVKFLIPALSSNRMELINFGLRTLEFWVDNLHPDYLYQVLAQDRDTLCSLMVSVTKHLQPGSQFGLLCARLVGKLGGRNRLYLHEIVCSEKEDQPLKPGLSIALKWHENQSEAQKAVSLNSFALRLPLESAVDVLRSIANAPQLVANKDESMTIQLSPESISSYVRGLFNEHAECLDLSACALELSNQTKSEQAKSAFDILRLGLTSILDLPKDRDRLFVPISSEKQSSEYAEDSDSTSRDTGAKFTDAMKVICDGLLHASSINELKEEAMSLLKGLGSHVVLVIESHIDCITRIDCDGAVVENMNLTDAGQNHLSGGKLQPLQPFGCFRLSGPLLVGVDPFVINQSIVNALASEKGLSHSAAEVLMFMLELAVKIKVDGHKNRTEFPDAFLEHLLSCLCQSCFAQPWDHRSAIMKAIMDLLKRLGVEWSKQFEVEIFHVALFLVKDVDVTVGCKEALEFFVEVTWFFYPGPASWDTNKMVYDVLSPQAVSQSETVITLDSVPTVKEASLTLVLSEFASTKQLARIAVRLFLRIVSHDNLIDEIIKDYESSLKRLIYPRILRNSPLPDQIATIESIAFMIEKAPLLCSIDDQTCLSFAAELLKMLSVADGDIIDTMSSVVLINKDGFVSPQESSSSRDQGAQHKVHSSSLFLRRSFNLQSESFKARIVVAAEVPLGVQLRVASIYLFRNIIRQSTTNFFDAETRSQVGNIRPHIVSLLFRSLTSESEEVVAAAESALSDALVLKEHNTDTEEDPKSHHKLPRELIQACIRPIILSLKDYTKLTLPLIRSVSRLLKHLTLWFNRSLGDKIIEHLYHLSEKNKILSLCLWKTEDVPKLAAAMIDLFYLMSSASRFVEVLVRVTLRLEQAWGTMSKISPLRDPLARYLNRNCASAVGFFIEEHRLSNPTHSELFIDILQREESTDLRNYMNTKESTLMLLNVCFERPLAIIRSEKNAPSSSSPSIETYGINPMNSYSYQRKLEIRRYEITSKKNQLARNLGEQSNVLQPVDLVKKELENARLAYSKEISIVRAPKDPHVPSMTTSALELQYQGFKIISTLAESGSYINLKENTDVVRALRWLWRSRARHYRLLAEDELQPRYSSESFMLAKFLITYSEANPSDIDVLFDLIRIFLNPTTTDFTFVKDYVHRRVTSDLSLEQREQVLKRYLTLLANEGSEENKILSTSLLILPMLKHTLSVKNATTTASVINETSIRQLMKLTFHGSFTSKLTCQLLQLINVLLEHLNPEEIAEYRKDILKYAWGILKNDETSAKYYAYVAVSRFVAAFETPVKVTLQLYRSLLRAHSTHNSEMIRASLNILVPALPKRLSPDELQNVLKYTIKVIQEEGNSQQQVFHILKCITLHPEVYQSDSSVLVQLMVNSLPTLVVDQYPPPDFKQLSISVMELIFEWSKNASVHGAGVEMTKERHSQTIDQTIFDAVANFLVKIIFLNVEGKVDGVQCQIHSKATSLLKIMLTYQPKVNLSEMHFNRVFDLELNTGASLSIPNNTPAEASKRGEAHKRHPGEHVIEQDNDHTPTVIAALEVLSILVLCKSTEMLIRLNTSRLIAICFSHGSSITSKKVQSLLKAVIANLLEIDSEVLDSVVLINLLEESISPSADSARDPTITIKKAIFAIDVLEGVCNSHPNFIKPFVTSLTLFAKERVHEHLQECSNIKECSISTYVALTTPTADTFHSACFPTRTKCNTQNYEKNESQTLVQVECLSAPLKALVQSIRLLGYEVLSTFTATRKEYVELLSLLLNSSTSIPVLITTLATVSDAVLATNQESAFIRSEKEELLLKIAKLDWNKLPPTISQVISDMTCFIILRLHGYDPSHCTNKDNNIVLHDIEYVTNKLLPICLMSRNKALRSKALSIFETEIYDCYHYQENLTDDAIDVATGKSPHKVIRKFLHADLDYVGNRLLTVILTDLLLAAVNYSQDNGSRKGYLSVRRKHDLVEMHEFDITTVAGHVYSSFVEKMSEESDTNNGRGRFIIALRNIIHVDASANQSILESCFQSVWQQLPNNDKISLVEPLEALLAKPYHSYVCPDSESIGPSNGIQSLLSLVFHLRPLPMIDTLLLSSLAAKYSAHYAVLAYLEKKYLALQGNGLHESPEVCLVLQRMTELFKCLGDCDVTLAIFSAMCSLPGTKFALSLEKYGQVNEAADSYFALIEKADTDGNFIPPKSEVNLWSNRWVDSHRELSQWSVIDEVANNVLHDSHLMLESAWKNKNMHKVKSLLHQNPSIVASIECDETPVKLTELYLAIHEGAFKKADMAITLVIQQCLYKWALLPKVKPGIIGVHQQYYREFQRLVELRESCQMLYESSTSSARRSFPDFKTILSSWRSRNPNIFEPVSVWQDLYSWRLHVFDTIDSMYSWNEHTTVANLHDRSFASILFGRVARKQGKKHISISLINALTDRLPVSDAFLHLREQIVAYQQSTEKAMLTGGLNLVNTTNLTYFDSQQKAELFRLKGYFFDALNDKSHAHKSYSQTLQIDPKYARAWIDWGNLCASLPDNSSTESQRKTTIQYMAQAMGCYLEAIRCDASEQSREYIPHCLSMLSIDSSQFGHIYKAFESRAPLTPAWVWLPWIPQLLTSLCRAEASSIQAVLMRIANDHPQALYYSLRAFFLERRDIEKTKDQGSESKQEEHDAQKYAEVLMSTLRKSHPVLWSNLESIIEDLIIRFRPSYESELLATFKALLEKAKCAKLDAQGSEKKDKSDINAALLESLRGNLCKISQKFFNKEKSDSTKGRKTLLFEKNWSSAFDSDFIAKQEGPNGEHQVPTSVDDLIEKLESWKKKLEHHISLVPTKCHLQETSPSLSWYSGRSNDLWPGACESASLSESNSQHDYHSTLDNALYEATRLSAMAAHNSALEAVVSVAKAEGLGGHEGGGSTLVEIPGQYPPTSASVLDGRPFPELHAKLAHFHQTLEVVSTPSRQDQTVRQITMIGSDGKRYKFSLQLAIPYWTRTDERSAQLQYVMGKILRKDIQACRRGLSVRPNVAIPVAQRMRMAAQEPSYTSLDSVHHHVNGPEAGQLVTFFEEEVKKRIASGEGEDNDEHAEEKAKLDVYRQICQVLVPKNVLSKYMANGTASIEQLMQFRKVFASQLALNSLLQHAFAVIERTPPKFVFCNRTGRVLAQDFRFQYNQGIIEAHSVPFRMTRNIIDFIGPFVLEGSFIPTFVTASSALNAKRLALEPVLLLLLRDDIMSWYTSKTQPRNDKKMQEMEHQLSERVKKNIRYVQTRLKECSTREVSNAALEAVSENPQPIDAHVRDLVDAATNEEKLCLTSSSYQAWL